MGRRGRDKALVAFYIFFDSRRNQILKRFPLGKELCSGDRMPFFRDARRQDDIVSL